MNSPKNSKAASQRGRSSRRKFLGATAAGAAALSGGGPAAAQTPGSGQGRGRGRGSHAQSGGRTLYDIVPTPPIDAKTATENWQEPWVWRPDDWPSDQLDLNVVEYENPVAPVIPGNPNATLFSYGANTPGPTVRMKGDGILKLKLRNMLGEDLGKTPVGPSPDPNELTPELTKDPSKIPSTYKGRPRIREDFCLGEHTNGLHSAHVTNIHTHGLHVRPGRNPDGTHSDNVILRVVPQADFKRREAAADNPQCSFLNNPEQTRFLRDDEQVGEANYEFRIGDVQGNPNQPHPPGTHWYHPHSHGSTSNQVASGMAGFLIVEGDVDEVLNRELAGDPHADPGTKTGPWDYRERLMLVQRVLLNSKDPDSANPKLQNPPAPFINGAVAPKTITMRPGAVERWRVLNGSIDGRGFKRIMVLKGQWAFRSSPDDPTERLYRVLPDPANPKKSILELATRADVDKAKQHIWQLSMDGVTLVKQNRRGASYTIKDLGKQNAGTTNPLAGPEKTNAELLANYEKVFTNGKTIRDTWVRPNEVFLGPANRCDLLYQAPSEEGVYTIFAEAVVVHADNYEQGLQGAVQQGTPATKPGPNHVVMAYLAVNGKPVEGLASYRGRDSVIASLESALPPVPEYLRPIADRELRVGDKFRTRTTNYSGWGAADFPLTKVPESFISEHPELKNLTYTATRGKSGKGELTNILLPPAIRTMAINGRKFDPNDPDRPRMVLDQPEEWALYNCSSTLWGNTNPKTVPGYQYNSHYISHPMSRAEGRKRFAEDQYFRIVTKGVDHPFHMHQNPFWVLRIEIPDENGELHNILDEPRWQDVVWIPRNGGRVVFRSRFPDYVGLYVNHCHLLQHEDNGMMQVVEVTPFSDRWNGEAKDKVSSPRMSSAELDRIYPRPTAGDCFRKNMAFVDPNMSTGQVYPGFDVGPPEEDD